MSFCHNILQQMFIEDPLYFDLAVENIFNKNLEDTVDKNIALLYTEHVQNVFSTKKGFYTSLKQIHNSLSCFGIILSFYLLFATEGYLNSIKLY